MERLVFETNNIVEHFRSLIYHQRSVGLTLKKMKYHIGLGSNIGERKKNLAQAIALLQEKGIRIVERSSVYETSPVGEREQPWFLNQVIEVQTDSDPGSLLRLVKSIEKQMGRKPDASKGPRCIDIDILLAENRIVSTQRLTIPHPELANRNFVLFPLKEIACDTVHPVLKEKIGDLWRESKDRSIVRFYMPA
jgi:2-amino-4-hydroxy-6-hydroxymethyldihydropteridine diphosphokinase